MEELLFKIFQNDQQRVQYTQSMKHMICGYFQWLIPMFKKKIVTLIESKWLLYFIVSKLYLH